MNIAVICDTSYQLMNMLNYVYHRRQEGNIDQIDVFIGQQFHNCKAITERISKETLFDHVYSYNVKKNAIDLKTKVKRVFDILFPLNSLYGQLIDHVELPKKNYDLILASMVTHFSASMVFAFPEAELIYYDDGTGSYVHELNKSMISDFNQKIYQLLGRDLDRLTASKIYLNNPPFANESVSKKAEPLPRLADAPNELIDIFRRVWDYSADGYYRDHKFIFLTEPLASDKERISHNILISNIQQFKDQYIVRPHPSQKELDNRGVAIDDHKEMWEIVCADQITDEHVLVSSFSTAQMIPKILFDKEPTLVVSCKLIFSMYNPEVQANVLSLLNRLKGSYRDPAKVIIPETEEELAETIARLSIAGGK